MISLPDTQFFSALVMDHRFAAAVVIATVSGLVRGFSGFGGALIYMPLVAAVYDPRIAAVTLLLIDFVSSSPFTIPELRRATWREVLPISIAMAVAVPFGTWALIVLDPIVLRWGMAVLVLGLLAVLASGWRYRGEPRLPITLGVGLFAGFGAGAVQIAGPAVIIYWLSRGNTAATMRANLMVFFTLCGAVLVVSYYVQGLFAADALWLALLLGFFYLAGIGVGTRFFRGASDQLYRKVAYGVVALAALLSLPVLDNVLR